jgi:hypothetical protein
MPGPEAIARTILDRVEAGELDIIPDEIGLGMYYAWKDEPSKLAAIFHKIYHEE